MNRADDALSERLFRAARLERPSPDARRRVLHAMLADRASDGGDPDARESVEQPVAHRDRRARHVPFAIGAAACAALLLLVVLDQRRSGIATPVTAEPFAATPPTAVSSGPVPSEPAPSASAVSTPRGPARIELHAPAMTAQPMPPTLGEEIEALDAVRRALGEGATADALRQLDRYDARGRQLAHEATLLRIEALVRAGRSDAATKLADDFVAHNPNSPLCDRARALVSRPSDTTPDAGENR